jgi:hypothetical protein
MRSTRRSTLVVGAALCATAIAGLGTAEGHRFNAPTTVRITNGGPTGANGVVSSPRAVCVANRTVTLFKVQGARHDKIGTATTDAQGQWRVQAHLLAGFYQATVSAKTLPAKLATAARKRKHRHHCQAGISLRMKL